MAKICKKCKVPLEGFLYWLIASKIFGLRPSTKDPELCNKSARIGRGRYGQRKHDKELKMALKWQYCAETPLNKFMKLFGCLLFSVFYLLVPWVLAQDSDQSSSDSGVLVSSPIHAQVSDQDSAGDNGGSDASSDHSNINSLGYHKYRHAGEEVSSPNTTGNRSNSVGTLNSSTDEIIIKSTNAVMSQITANMKLTQDQISAVQVIIADNIAKVRNLQLSLGKGSIDAKTMNSQRELFNNDENQKLSQIFTSDQMKVWMNIQSP